MENIKIADRLNSVYREVVNNNKISDYYSNNQSREFLEEHFPELNIAVTEFLAIMMASKKDATIDFINSEKDEVCLYCHYEDTDRVVTFGLDGRITSDEKYQYKEKDEK